MCYGARPLQPPLDFGGFRKWDWSGWCPMSSSRNDKASPKGKGWAEIWVRKRFGVGSYGMFSPPFP